MGLTTPVLRQVSLDYWEIKTTTTALENHKRETLRKSKPAIRDKVVPKINSALKKLNRA